MLLLIWLLVLLKLLSILPILLLVSDAGDELILGLALDELDVEEKADP